MSWKTQISNDLNRIRRTTESRNARGQEWDPINVDELEDSPGARHNSSNTYSSRHQDRVSASGAYSYDRNGRQNDVRKRSRDREIASNKSTGISSWRYDSSISDVPGQQMSGDAYRNPSGSTHRRSRSRSQKRHQVEESYHQHIQQPNPNPRLPPQHESPQVAAAAPSTRVTELPRPPPAIIKEISLNSGAAVKLHSQFERTLLRPQNELFRDFVLLKVCTLENRELEERFEAKQVELQTLANSVGYNPDEVSLQLQYGFLATVNLQLMERVANEGLATTMCPINILGHCVSGVHLCFHGDVCLKQAAEEAPHAKNIILVMFKFVYGRKNRVSPSDGFFLLAPTPNMHSHVSRDLATPDMSLVEQHKRSLVYLYEFKNQFFHPVTRPRLCCPVAALVFQRKTSMVTPLFSSNSAPLSDPPPIDTSKMPPLLLPPPPPAPLAFSTTGSADPNAALSNVLNTIGLAAAAVANSGAVPGTSTPSLPSAVVNQLLSAAVQRVTHPQNQSQRGNKNFNRNSKRW